MNDDPRKAEGELLNEGLPLINAMGKKAADDSGLNEYAKAQLTLVAESAAYYVGKDKGFDTRDENLMPHEWGSMDTYDDMRNSLRAASVLMEHLIDPLNPECDLKEVLLAALDEGGFCATHESIIEKARELTGCKDDDELMDYIDDHREN